MANVEPSVIKLGDGHQSIIISFDVKDYYAIDPVRCIEVIFSVLGLIVGRLLAVFSVKMTLEVVFMGLLDGF